MPPFEAFRPAPELHLRGRRVSGTVGSPGTHGAGPVQGIRNSSVMVSGARRARRSKAKRSMTLQKAPWGGHPGAVLGCGTGLSYHAVIGAVRARTSRRQSGSVALAPS